MAVGLLQNPGATEETNPSTVGQSAQDVAKAQGVAFEDIAKGAETTTPVWADYNSTKVNQDLNANAQVKPATSYMDNAKSTVAGQLSTLLQADSPYIKQAETKAKEQAASRGLLNSSIAAGAGRTAAIESALPIAQQDAAEYNKFSLQQQAAENEQVGVKTEAIVSGEMSKQKADIAQKTQNIQNAFNARITGASEQSKVWIEEMAQQHETGMQELEYEQTRLLQEFSTAADKAESVRTQTSSIMQNYQISVENLLTDPDFLSLGSAALNNAVNELQKLAKNSIMLVGASSGIDMSSFVNTYLQSLYVR